jgi:hypothetical protein
MQSLNGHSGPRQYLDAQFTYERENIISKVLKSALVRMRVYYAAVEHVAKATGEREVWASVCLVYYNLRDREGYIFGYKDQSESMGPCECACPASILDLLTPTNHEYALDWRARCRSVLDERRARASKPAPRPGQTIMFDTPVPFSNGQSLKRLEIVANPRSPRAVLFRDPQSGSLYRIRNVRKHTYRLVSPE